MNRFLRVPKKLSRFVRPIMAGILTLTMILPSNTLAPPPKTEAADLEWSDARPPLTDIRDTSVPFGALPAFGNTAHRLTVAPNGYLFAAGGEPTPGLGPRRVYSSKDGGRSWTASGEFCVGTAGIIGLRLSPRFSADSNPDNTVLALCSDAFSPLRISRDGGLSFSSSSNSPPLVSAGAVPVSFALAPDFDGNTEGVVLVGTTGNAAAHTELFTWNKATGWSVVPMPEITGGSAADSVLALAFPPGFVGAQLTPSSPGALMSLNPPAGKPGDTVTATGINSGTGFSNSASVSLKFDGSAVGSAAAAYMSGGPDLLLAGDEDGSPNPLAAFPPREGGGTSGLVLLAVTNITLSPPSGPPGTGVTVNGFGFAANAAVEFRLDGTSGALLGSGTADGSGNLVPPIAITILSSAVSSGKIRSVKAIVSGSIVAAADFTVTPFIFSFSPDFGLAGTQVVIQGQGFGSDPGLGNRSTSLNRVDFGGRGSVPDSSFVLWSDTQIILPVPSDTSSGDVRVMRDNRSSNTVCFRLSSVSGPCLGGDHFNPPGFRTFMRGARFGSGETVTLRLGSASGPVLVTSPSPVVVGSSGTFSTAINLPADAPIGRHNVFASAASGNDSTRLNAFPILSCISPDVGAAGTSVTFTGRHFGATQGNSSARFTVPGGLTASGAVTSWNDTVIVAQAPPDVVTGSAFVSVPGVGTFTGSNSLTFTAGTPPTGPVITCISPDSGSGGAAVVITGKLFGPDPGVGNRSTDTHNITVGGTGRIPDANVTSWSDTQIGITLPATAITSFVGVTAGGVRTSFVVPFLRTAFGTSFTVPTGAAVGTHTLEAVGLKADGTASGDRAAALFSTADLIRIYWKAKTGIEEQRAPLNGAWPAPGGAGTVQVAATALLPATTDGASIRFPGGATATDNYWLGLNLQATGAPADVYRRVGGGAVTWSATALSQARSSLAATTVGSKALFAGGSIDSNTLSNVVDIYDNASGVWSTAALSQGRVGLAATTVGTKALFAGGVRTDSGGSGGSNVVDIYDSQTNTWSAATLTQARTGLAATTVGSKALFAGGIVMGTGAGSNVVDIYDSQTNTWSAAALSQARFGLAATTVGTKALFAGGSNVVDIYDNATGVWSTAAFSQARQFLAATSVGNKALFAGGNTGTSWSNVVDIATQLPPVFVDTDVAGPGTSTRINGLVATGSFTAGTVFAGVGQGGAVGITPKVYKSSNGAQAWGAAVEVSDGRGDIAGGGLSLALANDFATNNTLYAASSGDNGGVHLSTDGGATWGDLGLTNQAFTWVRGVSVFREGDEWKAFANVSESTGAQRRALFRTENYGPSAAWVRVDRHTNTTGPSLVSGFPTPKVAYSRRFSVTSQQILKSVNGGPFTPTATDPGPDPINTATHTDQLIFAGATNGKVWRSTDGGATWSVAATDLGGTVMSISRSSDFAVGPPVVGVVAASAMSPTGTMEVWASYDGGASFGKVGSSGGAWGVGGSFLSVTLQGPSSATGKYHIFVRPQDAIENDIFRAVNIDPANLGATPWTPIGSPEAVKGTRYASMNFSGTLASGIGDGTVMYLMGRSLIGGATKVIWRTYFPYSVNASTWSQKVLPSVPVPVAGAFDPVSGQFKENDSFITSMINSSSLGRLLSVLESPAPASGQVSRIFTWTDTVSFLTPPTVTEPVDGATFSKSQDIQLKWNAVPLGVTYQYEIAKDLNFSARVSLFGGAAGQCPPPPGTSFGSADPLAPATNSTTAIVGAVQLEEGVTYFYHVRVCGVNSGGNTLLHVGPWSMTRSFSIVAGAAISLTPTSGKAGDLVNLTLVRFGANQVVEVRWDNPNMLLAAPTTDSQGHAGGSFQVPGNAPVGLHVVRASSAGGPSSAAAFTVNSPTPPGAPTFSGMATIGVPGAGGSTPPPGYHLNVTVFPAGGTTPLAAQTVHTDGQGGFAVLLPDLVAGSYDIMVKGMGALSKKKLGVALPQAASAPPLSFGTLRTGDLNGDDVILGADYSILVSNFGLSGPETAPSAFLHGYGVTEEAPTQQSAVSSRQSALSPQPSIGLSLSPLPGPVAAGERFSVRIVVDTGTQAVDAVDAFVRFAPELVQVVVVGGTTGGAIQPGELLPVVLLSEADNTTGQLAFSGGRVFNGRPAAGSFTLATVRLMALVPLSGDLLPAAFEYGGARVSGAYYLGQRVAGR